MPLAIALRNAGYDVAMMAPHDEYAVKLINNGFEVTNIGMKRSSLNPFREFILFFKIWKILRNESTDIIFNFTIKCAVYGSLVAKLIGIKRRINAVTGLGSVFTSESKNVKLLLPVVKYLLRLSLRGTHSRLVLQNPDDVQIFLDNSIVHMGRIDLIKGSGVNANKFNTTKKLNWQDTGVRRVLFASRLLWSKGIQYFVDIAKSLNHSKKYEFLIAGTPDSGNPESVEEAQLSRWAEEGIVTLLGHVDKIEILLAEVDLVVLPSRYGEGVPRILVEAAAASLPVVAFDNQGSREIVLDKINGRLVEKNSLPMLVDAIESIFESSSSYGEMCEASRKLFLNEFEEESVISRTLEVISKTKL